MISSQFSQVRRCSAGRAALISQMAVQSRHQLLILSVYSISVHAGHRSFCVKGKVQEEEDKLSLRLRIGHTEGGGVLPELTASMMPLNGLQNITSRHTEICHAILQFARLASI
jgi:hypothetical protein